MHSALLIDDAIGWKPQTRRNEYEKAAVSQMGDWRAWHLHIGIPSNNLICTAEGKSKNSFGRVENLWNVCVGVFGIRLFTVRLSKKKRLLFHLRGTWNLGSSWNSVFLPISIAVGGN